MAESEKDDVAKTSEEKNEAPSVDNAPEQTPSKKTKKKKEKSKEKDEKKDADAGSFLKRVILLSVVLLLLGTLCVAAWAAINVSDTWGSGELRSDGLPSVIRGEQFVVNLADRRAQHYARVDYALVLSPGVEPQSIRSRLPMIQEKVTPYFLSRTASELATPEGWEQARRTLNDAVRAIYSQAEVERIVVSELVVQ